MSKQTKPPMTAQQIFDKVLTGLRQQGAPSYYQDDDDRVECRYRAKNNGVVYKCAAGLSMDDGLYRPYMEGTAVLLDGHHIMDDKVVRGILDALVGSGVPQNLLPLVRDLQYVHDSLANDVGKGNIDPRDFPEEFELQMRALAKSEGLEYAPPAGEPCHE